MERPSGDKQERLGKYELLARLGEGGMGEVWKARDTQLQRYVAIKLLRADLRENPEFGAYFRREARLVAALRHPNIVQIHDFQLLERGEGRILAYMVMDYIEGGTLADALRSGPRQGSFWSASEIVDLFASISLALDYAHGQRMIHRDIKPANILLDRSLSTTHTLGEPVLTDFGIARQEGSSSTLTGFVGTPLYISPEQAQSRPVTERSDLYSLGIVLYEVLTGTTPFRGQNPLGVMLQHVEEPPPAPSQSNPLVSPALSAVVLQSIAKDPAERYPSATAMTSALARAFNLPVPALLSGPVERSAPSAYNPLQPTPGVMPRSSFTLVTPVQSTPPGTQTTSVNEGNAMTPAAGGLTRLTPAVPFAPISHDGGQQTPASQASRVGAGVPALQPQSEVSPAFPRRRTQAGAQSRPRRFLLLACLVCAGALLLGLGAVLAVPRLFAPSAPATPAFQGGGVVGQVRFLHRAPAPAGTLNSVQLDVNNVPPPPGGQVYYAWLEQTGSEAVMAPHWSLQVSNGAIHTLYIVSQPPTNLLSGSSLLLITSESLAVPPVVPYPDPAHHYYYAQLTPTTAASPTFEVRACPTSNVNSASNPCR